MKRIVLFLAATIIAFLLAVYLNQPQRIELKINRFEQELFSINQENVIEKSNKWDQELGSFNQVFATQIMRANQLDEMYYNELLAFTQNKDMREAYDSTILLFSDFSDVISSLELAFGQFSVDFPSYPIPEITTFFGGFNYGVITYDDDIGIGLENFLGKNSKYYKYLGNPEYLRNQKQKKFILSNVMEAWFNNYFQQYIGGRDFLSQIIYKGKMMYFLDKMLFDVSLEDKFRFTDEQMTWVQKNEMSIWEHFIYEELLFSNKESDFRSYIDYGPIAKGMPKEAPARVGYFIGYRMVQEYMKNNKISIEELMYLNDSRQFLRRSKYQPIK